MTHNQTASLSLSTPDAERIIDLNRPFFAELFNIISYTSLDGLQDWSTESSYDSLLLILTQACKAINLWDYHNLFGQGDPSHGAHALKCIEGQLR